MLTPETRTRRLLPGTIAAIDDLCESLEATDDPTAEASDWTEELNALHAVQAAPTVEVLAAQTLALEELNAWAQGHAGEADAAAVEIDVFAAWLVVERRPESLARIELPCEVVEWMLAKTLPLRVDNDRSDSDHALEQGGQDEDGISVRLGLEFGKDAVAYDCLLAALRKAVTK